MQMSCVVFLLCVLLPAARAGWIWVEGESPARHRMSRHPWYDLVKRDQFSAGDFLSNFDKASTGEAYYSFEAPAAGEYDFWIRANPVMSRLSYELNGAGEVLIDMQKEKRGEVNVASDDKSDLRFISWTRVGNVALRRGSNSIAFRMSSENNNHGYLDCFVFSSAPFQPRGLLKPDQIAAEIESLSRGTDGWVAFDPLPDPFQPGSALDLRRLNERFAGEKGGIRVKDGEFIYAHTGEPVRFWAVNGPPGSLKGEELNRCARMLAKRGVNLVRIHTGYFNDDGQVNMAKVRHMFEIVQAMKTEGIYSHLSIYFPLWMRPKADNPWLKGYDGKKHPFAALFFNPEFQQQYRAWWTALLTTPMPNGKTLAEEPALAALELQNEDSLFFWTFSEQNIPAPQLEMLETMFGAWAAEKYGSVAEALRQWNQLSVKRDRPDQGRLGFRSLWSMFNEKTPRDQDTVKFLFEVQTRFYSETYAFLRQLGFMGPMTASNWATASPEVFGPLEKWSYTSCDFIDRHGYFGCNHKGENAEWSIRVGHTYSDRSAYLFAPEVPGKPRMFVHPAMDVHYDGKPSMISETTWTRPNRYRGEAPLYLASYGALQHSDAIVHFALDGAAWAVKPGYFMQPWTLMSPTMMGQFPAAALIFRKGLVRAGDVLAKVSLNTNDLLRLKGTPLPQDAALDELRAKDLPQRADLKPGERVDPLIHYAGRTEVRFGAVSSVEVRDLRPMIDRQAQVVQSSTGELTLDCGKGVLVINAPKAQGASGLLASRGRLETADLTIESAMSPGHIVAVSLDDSPLNSSSRILVQVMSEEKPSGYSTEPAGEGLIKITSLGTDPWLIRALTGKLTFKRPDAKSLKIQALDANGYPVGKTNSGPELELNAHTLYYLITL